MSKEELKQEKEVYQERLLQQVNGIKRIIELLQPSLLSDESLIKKLRNYQKEAESLYRKLSENIFEISIVGLEKAGKSTFANAFMENDILPYEDQRCTYTSTQIQYGNDIASVYFYTTKEFNERLIRNLTEMGIEGANGFSIDTLFLEDYHQLYKKLEPKTQKYYQNSINQDIVDILSNKESIKSYLDGEEKIFEGSTALAGEELKAFITKPEKAIAVKEIIIESKKLKNMPNAIIYDVPGFDSPTKMHEEQTLEKMQQADAIVMIASASEPSFTGPSLSVFRKADDDGTLLSKKLFIYANKADRASTLMKNMDTVKKEVEKYELIETKDFYRIVFGSAKAHLQSLGKVLDEEGKTLVYDKIEEYKKEGILTKGDGIEYIRKILEDYHHTERFKVLKERINRNNQKIVNAFDDLRKSYGLVSDTDFFFDQSIQLFDEVYFESMTNIRTQMMKLLDEIKRRYLLESSTQSSITAKIKKQINEILDDKELVKIEEDKLNDLILSHGGDTSILQHVEKVEDKVREIMFKRIYAKFSTIVLQLAVEDHLEYFEKEMQIFCQALEVKEEGKTAEIMKEKIREYLLKYKQNITDKWFYQSLIERFTRDLFEILILTPYGREERLEKFISELNIFLSIVVYYQDDTLRKIYMSLPQKDQPLIYSLLFHEYSDIAEITAKTVANLQRMTGYAEDNPMINGLLTKLIKIAPKEAEEIVDEAFISFDTDNDKAKAEQIILRTLAKEIEKITSLEGKENTSKEVILAEISIENESKFIRLYNEYFSQRENLKTHADIVENYEKDLEILRSFLMKAAIPAINIEKPFVSREVKNITDIVESLNTTQYRAFVRENIGLLRKEEVDAAEKKMIERNICKSILQEIDHILEAM